MPKMPVPHQSLGKLTGRLNLTGQAKEVMIGMNLLLKKTRWGRLVEEASS